jgi:hypothetical protein
MRERKHIERDSIIKIMPLTYFAYYAESFDAVTVYVNPVTGYDRLLLPTLSVQPTWGWVYQNTRPGYYIRKGVEGGIHSSGDMGMGVPKHPTGLLYKKGCGGRDSLLR